MADNRIYLRCADCGACLFLGKSFYRGMTYTNYDKLNGDKNALSLEEKLNAFYEEHEHDNLLGTNFFIEHECMPENEYVKVTRCKDCKYYQLGIYKNVTCELFMCHVEPGDFCSQAERKDENE